jgi:short subunit fatty acids transporter
VIFGLISNVQPTANGLASVIEAYFIEVGTSREWVATIFISAPPIVFVVYLIKNLLPIFVIDSHSGIRVFL